MDIFDIFKKNKYDEIVKKEHIDLLIEDMEKWIDKGETYRNNDEYLKAIECYDEALKLEPDEVMVHIAKGLLFYKLGEYKKAIECYDKASKIDSECYGNYLEYRIEALAKLGEHREVIKLCDKILKPLKPDEDASDFFEAKGDALEKLGDHEKAIECYLKIYNFLENEEVMSKIKNIDNLDCLIPKCSECCATLYIPKDRIVGDFISCSDCESEFNIVTKSGSFVELKLALNHKTYTSDVEIISFAQAGILKGNDVMKEAKIQRELGNFKEAVDYFERAISCYDGVILHGTPFETSEAYVHKGITLRELHKLKDAIECFDMAFKIDPNYTDALYNKSFTLFVWDKYNEAIKVYEQLIMINPKDGKAWYGKGHMLHKLNNKEEAEKCIAKAKELGYEE